MTRPGRQSGHSLAGTMIFLVLVMLLWTAAGRQLASHLRADKAREIHRQKSTGCRQVMACALSLLETGEPPTGDDGICARRMIIEGETYVVIFTEQPEAMKYHVKVRPKMYASEDTLSQLPHSF